MDNIFLKNQVNLRNSVATPFIESGFTEKRVELCNPYELLVCNATTAKCDCGDYSLTSIYGERYAPRMIVSERGGSLRKKNHKICRWAHGTYCVPNNVTSSFDQNVRYDFGCTDGTSCKVKGSGKPCTMESKFQFVEKFVETISLKYLIIKFCCQNSLWNIYGGKWERKVHNGSLHWKNLHVSTGQLLF